MTPKKIVVLTGTRADYGKLKPLMQKLDSDDRFEMHIFVTGMHLLSKYGYTCDEVMNSGFRRIHKFINQNTADRMDQILSKTILGLSDFIREINPDLLIVHGDRVEALAGATVGALNNILTAHIEGGEVSGTVDELIRHAVTKLSHVHFVSNEEASSRLKQLGEDEKTIHVIGSPDIDVMTSKNLPSIGEVKKRYEINFKNYGILLFHPVTTELDGLQDQVRILVDEVIDSKKNYVVIFPNNDHGTEIIQNEYLRLQNSDRFRIFPSMRFEYFLSLLSHADFIIGNSSAGVREAPYYGIPTINLGSRQHKRVSYPSIYNAPILKDSVKQAISEVGSMEKMKPMSIFGDGSSASKFHDLLISENFWSIPTQKVFIDQ